MEVAIFCKIVDNFGDAGFGIRLARGLCAHADKVRIHCNNLDLLNKMCFLNEKDSKLIPKNLLISHFYELPGKVIPPADLIVELFQVEPPLEFLKRIQILEGTTRVMLDHLSTESWSDSYQKKIAPDFKLLDYVHPSSWKLSPAANRLWVSPGFSKNSSGLISNAWEEITIEKRIELREFILNSKNTKIKKNNSKELGSVFIVCIFLYEIDDVMFKLPVPNEFDSLALYKMSTIDMSQISFDYVLQSSNLNFVRGEDSFFSAIKASASKWKIPFFWQPYREKNDMHLRKFNGWKSFFSSNEFKSYWIFAELIASRNKIHSFSQWNVLFYEWNLLRNYFHSRCLKISRRKSLEKSLISCTKV
ncbi:MAG: hypothetical protein CBD16_05440 [Betaproteobacteria bacterium TMED156]|nr:MAG: hypothetical protein CBD16_05440 [Betaproteobacteria bacterium TMED156]